MKKIIVIIKVITILIVSSLCSIFIDFEGNSLINYSFIQDSLIGLFGIILAIAAIFFTIIDRYKQNNDNKCDIESISKPILNEMCDNVMGLLIIIIAFFLTNLFSPLLAAIDSIIELKHFSIAIFFLIFGLLLSLTILFDVTKSILFLIRNLFITTPKSQNDINKFEELFFIINKLDSKHTSELYSYLKTLLIKQELEKKEKEQTDKTKNSL